jgi:hypothetical protein
MSATAVQRFIITSHPVRGSARRGGSPLKRKLIWALALAAVTLGAQPPAPPLDWSIVPGERVGPVIAASTEEDLRRIFGNGAVTHDLVDIGEGQTRPGTVIYKSDPSRELQILWKEREKRGRPEIVMICPRSSGVCRWRTRDGIGMQTTLRELEQWNGRPFTLSGFEWDYSGTVTDWQGGLLKSKLEGRGRLLLRLEPVHDRTGAYVPALTEQEHAAVAGEKDILSSFPVMRKLNPRVSALDFRFLGR